ncbi:GNAT family N-acetyltransferase [Paenibacillus solisilvae]|uniref:GNAT family N-acetyltransferase n=1 Tax=Paenibacillus solisilvae TaxID=2486751 RepID=A0ABW0VRF7_9BACL
MKISDSDLFFRLHTASDSHRIVSMINRDPNHLLNGIGVTEFEQDLDEPNGRIREHTFVVELGQVTAGYFSLCFVERSSHTDVYCFGTVDMDWRRRGIGTAIFKFIFKRLQGIANQEASPVHFCHRAVSLIAGETACGVDFGMKEQSTLEILCLKNRSDLNDINRSAPFQFRSPALADAEVWADIYNDAFGGNKRAESVIHEFQSASFNPDLYLLGMNNSGEPIGLVSSLLRGTGARIPTLAVRRDWQRQGAGKALLSEILRRLQHTAVDYIRLSVESTNKSAKTLYFKNGFQPEYNRINYAAVCLPD